MTVDVHPHPHRQRQRRRDAAAGADGAILPRRRFNKAAFYRQCRMLHTYISAFAFLTLMFFAVTGITLNHPEWFGSGRKAADVSTVDLPPAALAQAMAAPDPVPAIAAAVAGTTSLRGTFRSGEIVGEEAYLRFEGVTGTSDLIVDLTTGIAEVEIRRATAMALLNDLHRGKNAGSVWSAFIDISAGLILALSVLGYVLFFSLRLRLATSLKLTALSLGAMAGMVWLFVP